jgi:hypothetical protein
MKTILTACCVGIVLYAGVSGSFLVFDESESPACGHR